jgi:chromosome segregation ATPase
VEQLKNVQQQLEQSKNQVDELKQIAESAQSQVQQTTDEKTSVDVTHQNEIKQYQDKIGKLKVLLNRAHQHISESNKSVSDTKQELANLKKVNAELTQQIAKVERGQNQLVEETVRFKTQEEVEKRLSNLTRVQREKETNYENTIRSLKEKLTDLEEEFKAYRVRAQSTSTAQSVVEADDDDDVTRKLQQKVNELRKQVTNLTKYVSFIYLLL